MNVSGFTTLNNNVTLLLSLNVSRHSTLRAITLNKNNVDPSGDSLNFWYNTPGTQCSGGDPFPGSNSGKITYNINGSDRHIMTSTGLGINTTSPEQVPGYLL